MLLVAYLLVVVPLLAVAVAATWVPRPWQVALLASGPVLTALGWAGAPGVERLGWLVVLGVPWALLVVLPVLPWRRDWARNAVPVTVLVVSSLLVGLAQGEPPVLFAVGPPVLLALGALAVAAVGRRDRRRAGSTVLAERPDAEARAG